MKRNSPTQKAAITKSILDELTRRIQSLPKPNTPNLRIIRREYSRMLAESSSKLVLDLAYRLLKKPNSIFRLIAYELITHHAPTLAGLKKVDLEKLGRGISSWGEVDTFACYLAGPVWRAGQVSDSVIKAWALSSDRWWRRAALVSTIPLNTPAQGGQGDTARTLEICNIVKKDTDPMVVKALSWALRALAKKDPVAVREFVKKNESILAALVKREVQNKLITGLKNPRSS